DTIARMAQSPVREAVIDGQEGGLLQIQEDFRDSIVEDSLVRPQVAETCDLPSRSEGIEDSGRLDMVIEDQEAHRRPLAPAEQCATKAALADSTASSNASRDNSGQSARSLSNV